METPVIILVKPQLGENIGSAARVMCNFGLHDLRVVSPRDGWPNPHAVPMSAGAFEAGVRVQKFDNLADSLFDQRIAYATTARVRGMEKPVVPLETVISGATKQKTALVFGPENSGLDNSDISLCDGIVTYPVDMAFKSLNLAQAVGMAAFSWANRALDVTETASGLSDPATKQALYHMFNHLESELDQAGFFFPDAKRDLMMNNLRNSLTRAQWTDQEVQTFRGVIKALAKGRGQNARKETE